MPRGPGRSAESGPRGRVARFFPLSQVANNLESLFTSAARALFEGKKSRNQMNSGRGGRGGALPDFEARLFGFSGGTLFCKSRPKIRVQARPGA